MTSGAVRLIQGVAASWPLNRLVCWRGPRTAPRVAITFDDGPRRGTTERVIAILKEHGVCATFFLEGRWVEESPELVQALRREGHEIGNHAYDHDLPDLCSQVRRCDALLQKLGIRTPWVRPPRGRISALDILGLAMDGRRIALWSFDAHDSMRAEGRWQGASPDYGSIQAGDIVLMHDDNELCERELPEVIASLRTRGLAPVILSELV
jgi:peptidoglycan-N-acetylglucosamine deacetylase